MIIIEKDIKIEHNKNHYTLYHLKTKKELLEKSEEVEDFENSEDPKYKIFGYYRNIKNSFLATYRWRKHKKYPFKESALELRMDLIKYKEINKNLQNFLNSIYVPIYTLKKIIFEKHKRLQNSNI